jgi:hypothetical protein
VRSNVSIPGLVGEVSDGYHTFNELYEHRAALFIALMSVLPDRAWVSRLHQDETMFPGFFIAGFNTPEGDITYHLAEDLWQVALCTGCTILQNAPHWDGHTPEQCIGRLLRSVVAGKLGPLRRTTDNQPVTSGVDPVGGS